MAIELKAPGARLEILPGAGGRIHQLWVEVDGREEPLLAAPSDVAEYAISPLFGGCFPMAPWPNRIAGGRFAWGGRNWEVPVGRDGHALHGTVQENAWDVTARVGRVCELRTALGEMWPWPGTAWQRIELGAGFLSMKLEVRSERDRFPAGGGWHPWFRRTVAEADDVCLTVPAAKRYVLENRIPTGEVTAVAGEFDLRAGPAFGARELDDCYTEFDGPIVLDWGKLALTIDFATPFPHAQAYGTADAVCIEPQSCAPDAFNLTTRGSSTDGTTIVAPGRPFAISSKWTWAQR